MGFYTILLNKMSEPSPILFIMPTLIILVIIKEFAAKEKLEIVQSERVASAGGRKMGTG